MALQTPWGVGEWIDVADCRWVWLVVIDDAGLLLGFCLGRAIQCRYKAGIESDTAKQEKLMKDCNWFIDSLARRKNMVREEIVAIVKSVVAKMEKDRIVTEVNNG